MQADIADYADSLSNQLMGPAQENSHSSIGQIQKFMAKSGGSQRNSIKLQKREKGNIGQISSQNANKTQFEVAKPKKINIKKLIQQKQARENRQKPPQQKFEAKITKSLKLFEPTEHEYIDRCLACGFIILNTNQAERETLKLEHIKKEHKQYSFAEKGHVETDRNIDQYKKIARELVSFAHSQQNREIMEIILGQNIPEPFEEYTELMPVKKQLQKWAKVAEEIFNIY